MRHSRNLRIIVSLTLGHPGRKSRFALARAHDFTFKRSQAKRCQAINLRRTPIRNARHNVALNRIISAGIVAVVRFGRSEPLLDAAEALLAGGVEVIEITLTVPNATRVVEQVADRLGDRVLLGAGTVLDPPSARAAIHAGARFLVSPVVRPDVIRVGGRHDTPVIPGALTPTEILTAFDAGADVVKVFPSDVGGPNYLKSLRGPLPHVRLMPTGGVNLETAAAYLRAGACALGIGGSLVEPAAIEAGDFARIESLARQYVESCPPSPSGRRH